MTLKEIMTGKVAVRIEQEEAFEFDELFYKEDLTNVKLFTVKEHNKIYGIFYIEPKGLRAKKLNKKDKSFIQRLTEIDGYTILTFAELQEKMKC